MDERGGYVKLYRKIRSNWLWFHGKESASRIEAWEDLIMDAEYTARDRLIEGHLVHNDRGQLTASIRFLAQRWHWGSGAVRGFLKKLEKAGQIRQNTAQGITQITICNYDYYNPPQHSEEQIANTARTQHEHKPKKERKKETNKKTRTTKIDEEAISRLSLEGRKILKQLQALPGWVRRDEEDVAMISAYMSLFPNLNYLEELVAQKIWCQTKGVTVVSPMRVRNWWKKAAEKAGG